MCLKFLTAISVIFLGYVTAYAQTSTLLDTVGKWQAVKGEDDIFEGTVNIVAVKTRPGSITSQILIIYDETQRGLICSLLRMSSNRTMCGAVTLNKENITADDRSDLVTNAMPDIPPVVIEFQKQDYNLAVKGCFITQGNCSLDGESSFKLLSLLKPQ